MNAKPALVRPSFASGLDPTVALWLARICLNKVAAVMLLNDGVYSDELRRIWGFPRCVYFAMSEPCPEFNLKTSVETGGHA